MKNCLQAVCVFMFCLLTVVSPHSVSGSGEDDAAALEDLDETSLDILLIGTAPDDAGRGFAVIQDRAGGVQMIYRVGDLIKGAEIMQIHRQMVVLELDGEREVLSFASPGKVEVVPTERLLEETEPETAREIIGYAPEVFIQRDEPIDGQTDPKMPVRRIIFKSKQKALP
jgi:type II secretory pathway component PulC